MNYFTNPNGNYSNGYMLSTGYGYPLNSLYQYYMYDQLMVNNNWYRPQHVIGRIYGEREKSFEAKRLRKSGYEYIVTERNGREVNVGKMRMKDKLLVNQHPDGTFDAFYCRMECEGSEPVEVVIPYKDFVKRNILPYIPFFRRNTDCPDVENNEEISQVIGEFISALVKLLSNSDIADNLITHNLKYTEFMKKRAGNEDYYASSRMLLSTAELLYHFRVITLDDMRNIIFYIRNHSNEMPDTEQTITNEFRRVLSEGIVSGDIEVATAESSLHFDPNKYMIYLDDSYVNLSTKTLDEKVLPDMKTTKRRNKLLSALKACGKLYSNNYYKRNLDIETSPGVTESFSVYSVNKGILDGKCQNKLKELEYFDYTFDKGQEPVGFMPIIKLNSSNKMLGCVINESTDECESMYVSGMSRSGKTRFLVEQAVIRYKSGKKVVVIDQTNAFSPEELEKHGVDKEKITHWDIGSEGTPVDLLSLENCLTLTEKKNRLFSIFAESASITGEVQSKLLRKKCSSIAKAIENGTVHSLTDTLRFFDKNDPEEAKIHERLSEVFDDLEGLPTATGRWDKLFDSESGIVVISTSRDGIRKKAPSVNMLLADLYEFKQHHRDSRVTVILDEIEDLNLEKDDPINVDDVGLPRIFG